MSSANETPLDITLDTTNVTTVVPLIAEGTLAKFKFVKASMTNGDKGQMIKFEYDLVAPVPNSEGGQILPGQMGAKMFENITLYDKNTPPGTVPDWAAKMIATRQDALLGTGDKGNTKGKPERPAFGPAAVEQMLGKELVAKMKIQKDEAFTSNRFQTVYFPGDVASA